MNKKEYEELQKTLKEVNATLADETLTADLRLQLENSAAALSGQLLSVWFPMSNIRRAIMLALFLLGLRAFVNNNEIYMVYWIFTLLLSPRIVGSVAYGLGRFMSGFK